MGSKGSVFGSLVFLLYINAAQLYQNFWNLPFWRRYSSAQFFCVVRLWEISKS